MKKYILLLLFASFFASCSEDKQRESETAEFLGKWKMTEALSDPGDGTVGTYVPVSGNFSIEFRDNGTIHSNYPLCPFYTGTATQFTTPYQANENRLLMNNCFSEGYDVTYQIEGDNLIFYYPCFEGCSYKFERITTD